MFKNTTEQKRNYEKYKHAWLLKFMLIMMVSERLRSCWGPSRLAHNGDLRSSQWTWSKPSEQLRACSWWGVSFLMRWVEGNISHCSRGLWLCQPEKSLCSGEFGCRPFIKHSPWAVCFLLVMWKKTCVFLWVAIRLDFPKHFTFRFCIHAKVLYSTWRTI